MPLSGSTYVAPTWRNGGPPALDAAELQAISDSIVRNQGKNADQDTLIAALQTAVGGKARIEVGSYVGTGTYGADNPCSITCSFPPKIIWIYAKGSTMIPAFDVATGYFSRTIVDFSSLSETYTSGRGFFLGDNKVGAGYGYAKKSNGGKTIEWYSNYKSNYPGSDVSHQLNDKNSIFDWIAFG